MTVITWGNLKYSNHFNRKTFKCGSLKLFTMSIHFVNSFTFVYCIWIVMYCISSQQKPQLHFRLVIVIETKFFANSKNNPCMPTCHLNYLNEKSIFKCSFFAHYIQKFLFWNSVSCHPIINVCVSMKNFSSHLAKAIYLANSFVFLIHSSYNSADSLWPVYA